jgi:thioredoxin 1
VKHDEQEMISELNEENLAKTVGQPGVVLASCGADWCGDCRRFAPVFERVARRYPDHSFVSLDTESQRALAEELGITRIPTLLVYRDGIQVFGQAGSFTEATLIGIIRQALALDMRTVRGEVRRVSNRPAT